MLKTFFNAFNKQNFKKLLFPFSLITVLSIFMTSSAFANDLLASGNEIVDKTLGKDSSLVRWLLILEVLAGIWMYIKTKNLVLLLGFVAVIIGINVAFSVF